jgi:hypothetical protein
MEQRLDVTYLRPGLIERAAATGIAATGIGTGILLAAWGISFLWHYTPPEITVRIANPEVRISQATPLTVTQDRPFVIEQPEPLKIDPSTLAFKTKEPPLPPNSGVSQNAKTPKGEVIEREVTVFSSVKHDLGVVVTGWNYRNGSGGVPFHQYCYYNAPNVDGSSTRIDLGSDGISLPQINMSLVPAFEEALEKCQWWRA